jgi:hypothetical protein
MRASGYRPPIADHHAIADRWAAQYRLGKSNNWDWINDARGARAIWDELVALLDTLPLSLTSAQRAAFIKEIDRIIGNDSWTR